MYVIESTVIRCSFSSQLDLLKRQVSFVCLSRSKRQKRSSARPRSPIRHCCKKRARKMKMGLRKIRSILNVIEGLWETFYQGNLFTDYAIEISPVSLMWQIRKNWSIPDQPGVNFIKPKRQNLYLKIPKYLKHFQWRSL